MRVGITGLPNVGKSSLFNVLTRGSARVDLFPFTTIEKNTGVVLVPDERLSELGRVLKPEKLTPAHVEFVDIAGLVKGASQGEGLGNKFLSHVREADLILHLVRAFSSEDIPHVLGTVDPDRDTDIVEAELGLADLAIVERRLEHVRKEPRSAEHDLLLAALERCHAALARGEKPALPPEQQQALAPLGLIMTKPFIYAVNCSDSEPADAALFPRTRARTDLLFSAALETALADSPESDRVEMRQGLGLNTAGPAAIVARCFTALDLIRFYTVKGPETRAWSARSGTTALEAAHMIHTDIGRGFIRAEVVSWRDLAADGDFHAAHQHGHQRTEGKGYVVQDGDVLLIHFR
jgi:GTP-binding protein YchF